MAPNYNSEINHPVQTGWLEHSREIDEVRENLLELRFEKVFSNTPEPHREARISSLLKKVDLAKQMTDSERDRLERDSRTKLHLNDTTIYETGVYAGRSRFDVYTSLAGRPAKTGRFIEWFTELAPEFFEIEGTYNGLEYKLDASSEHADSIGLELGGMWQTGDWSGTGRIDAMANDIPRQIRQLYPDAGITENKKTLPSYSVLPLGASGKEGYQSGFPYALVSRFRSVADITIPGRIPVEIKKASTAVLLIDQMQTEDRVAFRGLYKSASALKDNKAKNSEAAIIAGREFEHSIEIEREYSHTIIPVAAYYYMVADRPAEAA